MCERLSAETVWVVEFEGDGLEFQSTTTATSKKEAMENIRKKFPEIKQFTFYGFSVV